MFGLQKIARSFPMSGSTSADGTNESSNGIPQVPEQTLDSPEVDLEQQSLQPVDGELITSQSETNRKPFWGIAKKALGDASSRVTNTGTAVVSKAASLGTSGVTKVAELGHQTIVGAGNAVEASGAKQAIKATATAVSEKLDEVSGKRLVELLEKKLQIQDSYNDILATRLAEALARISILEARVNQLTSRP
jgi:hypothetical protein